ncbi:MULTISPECIES: DsbA family protein [unclassified Roseovarius]|uniref:DsbA family protein n=1 Tax=unclassified Roseovarius TaxID=2614913 RepID=UPI0027401A04|nr:MULTISPECIES: DsbA family protein [unclassified Roseovarius]
MGARVEVFYSLQSDYCYFLLDRLIWLAGQGIDVAIRPVLGGVLRLPDRYRDRDALEQAYFATDTAREAAYLGLPYAYPEPSPITFKPGSLWIAEEKQSLNERLNRLFVGAVRAGKGLAFLDHVARKLWDGSTPGWDKGDHLTKAMAAAGMDMDAILASTSWAEAKTDLDRNAEAMLEAGHWGVPLMVYRNEPFYGQDRFDQMVWRMGQKGDLPC